MPDDHVLTAGPPDGPPMVLVHGLGGASINWLPVIPRLAAHGFAISAPDLIGHGRTPRAGRRATIEENAAFLADHVASRGAPAVVVGNSMGGLLAMIHAVRAPASVAALVLVAPAVPRIAGALGSVTARAMAPALMRAGPLVRARNRRYSAEEYVGQNLRLCVRDVATIDADTMAAHVELARLRAADPGSVPSFTEASSSMIRAFAGRRIADTVRAVGAPTLIVAGRHDRLVPLHALERISALRPDWAMHVFDHCAHVPQLEDPDAFVEVVAGWLGHERASG